VVSLNSEVVSIPEGSKARTGIFAASECLFLWSSFDVAFVFADFTLSVYDR